MMDDVVMMHPDTVEDLREQIAKLREKSEQLRGDYSALQEAVRLVLKDIKTSFAWLGPNTIITVYTHHKGDLIHLGSFKEQYLFVLRRCAALEEGE